MGSRKANRKFPASQMSLFLSDWDLNVPPRSASCSIFPRKMMSLSMSSSDHFPSKREKQKYRSPKIQRLVTPVVLQRKRHRVAMKKKRAEKQKDEAAAYARLLALRTKEAKQKRAEELKRRRSR